MIKKWLISIIAAMVVLVSTVAAVSAFEAHTINVTAHVENALLVDTAAVNFGTVFPEEWLFTKRTIALSDSFLRQGRVVDVVYEVWAECKPKPTGSTGFFLWIGPALWLDKNDGDYKQLSDLAAGPICTASTILDTGFGGTLIHDAAPFPDTPGTGGRGASGEELLASEFDRLSISIDVPVFEGFYNEWTDVCDKPRFNFGGDDGVQDAGDTTPTLATGQTDPRHPTRTDGSGFKCQIPSLIIDGPDGGAQDPRWIPTGVDLGVDLKIQIVEFSYADGSTT